MTKIESICKNVCDEFGVAYAELVGKRRFQPAADARHVAIYLCSGQVPTDEIIAHFNRDRTLLIHARKKVDDMAETYPAFRNKVERLKKLL